MALFRLVRFTAWILTATSCAGCIHFHNETDAASAKKAQELLAAFREPAGSLYAKMLANQRSVAALSDKQIAASLSVQDAAATNNVPNLKWAEIRERLSSSVDRGRAAERVRVERVKAIQVEMGHNAAASADATVALGEARRQLKERTEKERNWRARRVFLMAMLKIAGQEGNDAPKTLAQAVEAAKKAEIPEYAVDGKPTTVADVLGDQLNGSGDDPVASVFNSMTFGAFSQEKYPGLNIIAMSLAIDLADSKLKRLQLDREIASRKLDVIEASRRQTVMASEGLADLDSLMNSDRTPAVVKPTATERVIDTFVRAHGAASRGTFANPDEQTETGRVRATINLLLRIIGQTCAAGVDDPAQTELLVQLRLARLDEERSIRLSALNAAEREAIVGRQLEGLRVYHDGGMRPEDLGNLIGSAQLAAQAFIAGRVK